MQDFNVVEPASPKGSITGKFISVSVMGVFLIFASMLISSIVSGRQESWDRIRDGLVATWAGPQEIVGPILKVPVLIPAKDKKGKDYLRADTAWFLPERLSVTGAVDTQLLHHGICKTSVYTSDVQISGSFAPDLSVLAQQGARPQWDKAALVMQVADLRGIRDSVVMGWDKSKLALEPGEAAGYKGGVLEARLKEAPSGSTSFSVSLKLRGSQLLDFVPVGKSSEVDLKSTWSSPEFHGPFFPDSKSVDANGFEAVWKVQSVNRSLPQSWFGGPRDMNDARFGVDFSVPVDYYRATSRAIQYATMFIFLTSVVFFFIEFFLKRRLHPMQYLLVGAGIVLFYLLLLSLAEHVAFPLAYVLAAAAIVGLIACYVHWIVQRAKATALVSGILSGLYAYLYALLQMEDYALLMGSVGLFAALAAIMYLTRDFDWYDLEQLKKV